MTLVIGIKCKNGIVVGADSMATSGGYINVEKNSTKIHVYDKNVIVGISGSVGMSQIELDSLKEHWQSEVVLKAKNLAKEFISRTAFTATLPYLEFSKTLLNGQIDHNLFTGLLVAAPICEEPVLLMFDHQKSVMEADENIFFLSLGSGAPMAEPFLKFIDRVSWKGEPPQTINDGVFGVLWALHHVIQTNATMGVGGNPQIAILEIQDNKGWHARILPEEELLEHQDRVIDAEENISDYISGPNEDSNSTQ